ncbi:hypothetical protein [Clostridioides difficile]|uniref:hypothetical protein n=1 Tax=Clostridioides difficile TaxID=1496 RepID=UPI001C1C530D|nr:hypothetical protein [Clostridioides difficile]MCJ0133286.1 hypothetical protein [Clostridioides difficile]MCJ0174311.1 hypothetical protein [Clostridioides difficile]MCU5789019.1 hypothetical protein [Clostridioides difficile]MCU6074428.1 hypothetical protein [Clostridioides difficile]MDB0345884.1 hypothetical protein [Clostridioides difficile]
MINYSEYMTAIDLINICDLLEGKTIGEPGTYNSLSTRLGNLIGLDWALKGEELRQQLIQNINNMMYLDNENKIQYKEF